MAWVSLASTVLAERKRRDHDRGCLTDSETRAIERRRSLGCKLQESAGRQGKARQGNFPPPPFLSAACAAAAAAVRGGRGARMKTG